MKNRGQRIAIRDFGLRLNAMLVRVLARSHIRQPLMGQDPSACITAQAQNLRPRAHLPVRRVVKHVALETARRLYVETRLFQPAVQPRDVQHPEFDLSLDRHRKQ